jgi:hypothetical protein
VGGACNARERDEKCKKNVIGNPKRKRPLEDLGIDGKIILEPILGKLGEKL